MKNNTAANWKAGTVIMSQNDHFNGITAGEKFTLINDAEIVDDAVKITFKVGNTTVNIKSQWLPASFREVPIEERQREFMVILHHPDNTTTKTCYKNHAAAIEHYTHLIINGHIATLTNKDCV